MPRYIVTVKARFPETVEENLDALKDRLRERGAFRLAGHDLIQNGPHLWIPVSVEIDASTPADASLQALRAFEDDAQATIGACDALDMAAVPPEGTIQRMPFL